MGSYLEAARDQCINISNQFKSELSQFDFNFGTVFYRDPVDCPGERNHTYSLKSNVESLKSELASERADGGGDGPEDWVGGYDMALDNITWRNGTRLIIHIADAPAMVVNGVKKIIIMNKIQNFILWFKSVLKKILK